MFIRNSGRIFRNSKEQKSFTFDNCQNSALDFLLTAGRGLNEWAVYDFQPYACFKLAEVVEDILRKSISRVNHGLTHIAPAPPVLVTYD